MMPFDKSCDESIELGDMSTRFAGLEAAMTRGDQTAVTAEAQALVELATLALFCLLLGMVVDRVQPRHSDRILPLRAIIHWRRENKCCFKASAAALSG